MVHEKKFKNPLSSTCQVHPERIVLDLESEVMRGPGSILVRANRLTFFTGFFGFQVVKPMMPILALLATLFNYEKPRVAMW